MIIYYTFFILQKLTLVVYTATSHDYIHRTRLGDMRGLRNTSGNITVYQFRKIPYAKPPISSLRFEKPHSFGSWGNILDATAYGPNCMQYLYDNDKRLIPNWDISEDCLHLNVIAPNDLHHTSRRPVFIWIHGGGFTNGQGMMFDGSEFVSSGNVVLVTINYRLNIFGFVNVGKNSPRNLGLWDQKLAIQWVKENIVDYGGDSNTLTIFGESAGGVSVGLQAIIPSNIGLFQRAIAQSGSCLSLRDIGASSENLTRETGRVLNCSDCQIGQDSCLDCMRKVPAQELLNGYSIGEQNLQTGFSLKDAIGPVPDNDLIPDMPDHMLSDPQSASSTMFNSIDFMTGANDGEAGLFYFYLISEQTNFNFDLKKGIPFRVLCDNIVPYVSNEVLNACSNVSRIICAKYTPEDATSLAQATIQAINVLGDLEMSSLATRTLDFHTRSHKRSYQYLFTHEPTWGLIQDRPAWLLGANHADELAFIFSLKGWYPTDVHINPTESDLSKKMMSYWHNFGKTGDPNPAGSVEWPQYNSSTESFMLLGEYRNSTVDRFTERMKFWNEEIPQLISECPKLSTNINIANSGFG